MWGPAPSCATAVSRRIRPWAPAELVTGIANPSSTAEAMVKIMTDTELRVNMSKAGMERVRRYYNEADLNETYRGIYRNYVDWQPDGADKRRAG